MGPTRGVGKNKRQYNHVSASTTLELSNVTNASTITNNSEENLELIAKNYKRMMDLQLEQILKSLPEDFLKKPCKLDTPEDFDRIFMRSSLDESNDSSDVADNFAQSVATVKKVANKKVVTLNKTPVLPSADCSSSVFKVKRILRLDEEAVSKCGSPLFVHTTNVAEPHVVIPLLGGAVLDIEPKKTTNAPKMPGLNKRTKRKLQILCENIQKCLVDCDDINEESF